MSVPVGVDVEEPENRNGAYSGSVKRVASAVGEGSMAVRLVHQRLAAG